MTVDLVQFLRDRLDEDEAVARAAGGITGDSPESVSTIHTTTDDEEVVAEHVARHDPARALSEVEATRRLIRAHEKWCEGRCEAKYPEGGFDAAHYWNIKVRAEVYADHPDYRAEWRP